MPLNFMKVWGKFSLKLFLNFTAFSRTEKCTLYSKPEYEESYDYTFTIVIFY